MSSAATIETNAADWVARQDRGAWSDDDARALDAWLATDTAHRVAYLRLRAAWDRADRLRALNSPTHPAVRQVWPLWNGRNLPIAASVGGFLLIGALAFGISQQLSQKTYATQLGGRETVQLADGSHLVLNTDTVLKASVTTSSRLVHLDRGEAFFDVKHDPAHPFVVLAGNRRITDLGTKFSVRRDGDKVWVVVSEGRVRIEAIGPRASFGPTLIPAVVTRGGVAVSDAHRVLVVHQDDSQLARDLSWREGLISFNQTTLGDAASEFNRYSDKKLIVVGQTAANVRIDGAFRSDNVDSFANLLREGFGLKVEDDGNEIRISE